MAATVTRLSDRQRHTVTLPSQGLAESGIEVTTLALRLAALMSELAAANAARPRLVKVLRTGQRDAGLLVLEGRRLCALADPDHRRAA
jgi:hypothetical protein